MYMQQFIYGVISALYMWNLTFPACIYVYKYNIIIDVYREFATSTDGEYARLLRMYVKEIYLLFY